MRYCTTDSEEQRTATQSPTTMITLPATGKKKNYSRTATQSPTTMITLPATGKKKNYSRTETWRRKAAKDKQWQNAKCTCIVCASTYTHPQRACDCMRALTCANIVPHWHSYAQHKSSSVRHALYTARTKP